ncbi:MAG: sulfur carrier protein ThiS [Gammaproteobacteria bacterium]|nr:sulfur carrier protein ThiS [Gammaproteobacteria bacterium]
MELILNGERRSLSMASTVAALVSELNLQGRFAIEVNGEIVTRSRYAERRLDAEDVIEIVRAIGGG